MTPEIDSLFNSENQDHPPVELNLLGDISEILSDQNPDMDHLLQRVIIRMAEGLHLSRVFLSLFNRNSGQIFISKSFGLSEEERSRGIYTPGEGITGRVVDSGEPYYAADISRETRFLNKMRVHHGSSKQTAFFCIPIKSGQEVIGTVSAFGQPSLSPLREIRLMGIITSMISQTAQLYLSRHEEYDQLQKENLRLHQELEQRFRPSNIVGNSKAMQPVFELIDKVKDAATTVLILGESGVGKELVARAIHYTSPRKDNPFIAVNCAALPENLVESELFGHEKGSFTGAENQRRGKFELSDKGSIFLDEIGELPLGIQAKLLRILQEGEFVRVGGVENLNLDVRILAATNRNLEEEVKKGNFREDLYYRLNIIPITVPPLRERKTDILQLANLFIEKYSRMNKKNITRISTPAIDMLMAYHWPGNVRELENCIERAVILSDDEVIHGYHLPPTHQIGIPEGIPFSGETGALQRALDTLEYEMLVEALKACRGNLTHAAGQLGLTNRKMGLRMKKYRLDFKVFRQNAESATSL